ncbi:MAG: response regulator [Desulfobacterales bacterium]|nr:response regulator [Desulfobacterales bacterium]
MPPTCPDKQNGDSVATDQKSHPESIDKTIPREDQLSSGGPGAPDILSRIISIYLADSERAVGELKDAVTALEASVIHRTAHALKSSSANVGAMRLSALFKEMEAAGRLKSLTETADLLGRVESEYKVVRAALGEGIEKEVILAGEKYSLESPVVLVADDDSMMRLLARESLRQAGFKVCEAVDGAEALKVFEKSSPDIVLLDVNMPNIDGFRVCAAIRKYPGAEQLPILMITGLDDVDSIRRPMISAPPISSRSR